MQASGDTNWLFLINSVWSEYLGEKRQVINLSGKSPRGSSAKKAGKSIIEKRAEKKSKAESSDLVFAKPRKTRKA